MANIKKIKVGTTTYDIRDATAARSNHTHSFDTITNRGEAFLSWGGKNFSGSYGPIDAAMVPELGANRLAFMPANAVTIEYSRDGGSTWTDYGPTDSQKIDLFNDRGASFTIGKATSGAGNIATNKYQLRVNIYTSAGQVYTALNKFVIYLSTSGTNNNWCTIRARTQSDYTAGNDKWTTFADKISVSGWSGYNVINTSSITTYGNTASTQYGHIQFIFGCDTGSTNNSYAGLNISKIFGFGGVGWTTPSTMAKTGHMYTYDSSQNVTFPEGVFAKSFTENGTSLANKYAAKSHTHNYAASDSAGGPANSVKNALTFGSKTYNGSSAQTITLVDLGGQAAGNYVTTDTTQTISGAKTFTGVQKFTGESRFSNDSYCPDTSIADIANGIGKSSLFARSATMQTITGQIMAPNANGSNETYGYASETGKIKLQYISAFTATKVTGTDIAVFDKDNIKFTSSNRPTWSAPGQAATQLALKSDIHPVNNATLTIQKNGTTIDTFTANSSTDKTINITVPTGAAASKGVDTSISAASASTNLPTSAAVASFVEGKGYKTTLASNTTASGGIKYITEVSFTNGVLTLESKYLHLN